MWVASLVSFGQGGLAKWQQEWGRLWVASLVSFGMGKLASGRVVGACVGGGIGPLGTTTKGRCHSSTALNYQSLSIP